MQWHVYVYYIGKWKTSFKNWPWQRFPIYFQGGGVVIAGSAVRPILAAMQVTPYFIWDDMYLIGLCAVKAKVQLRTSNQYILDIYHIIIIIIIHSAAIILCSI